MWILDLRAWSKPSNIFLSDRTRLSQSESCLSSLASPDPARLLCDDEKPLREADVSTIKLEAGVVVADRVPPSSWTLRSAVKSREAKWLPKQSGDVPGTLKSNQRFNLYINRYHDDTRIKC